MRERDGHIRVLPLHVANKIAAGEVVERPASVVKELVENAIDAGAKSVRITVTQGGRKLVAVQDDGCGMSKDDAILSLERQATSKIFDVDDIEKIDTLGFRGEAIPSIASVSRFSITTRRRDSDEGTFLQVNAGTLAEVRPAGCPPGTIVEVRDLFCNVPARRKFLRSYATEECHVKSVFTIHALAHPSVAFSLTLDGRELYTLAPAPDLEDRVRDLFGQGFLDGMLPMDGGIERGGLQVRVRGLVERPNLSTPTRREQFVFVNGRPATAPSVAGALREAYPRRPGDVRPAVIMFIELPPSQVDVNVHPTKREVRFRDNVAVRHAVEQAVLGAMASQGASAPAALHVHEPIPEAPCVATLPPPEPVQTPTPETLESAQTAQAMPLPAQCPTPPSPEPVQQEISLEISEDGRGSRPWRWFNFLAQSASGYLLVETDAGIVTINPIAARERIAYEKLLGKSGEKVASQALLIPETVRLSPVDAARIEASMGTVRSMGFQLEPFGPNVFKIDAVPQLLGPLSPAAVLSTIAHDLSESGGRRGGEKWREELVAKSIARSFAGAPAKLDAEGATRLVEELCATRMPYVCPRGKPVMIFTSTRELDRKFDRA